MTIQTPRRQRRRPRVFGTVVAVAAAALVLTACAPGNPNAGSSSGNGGAASSADCGTMPNAAPSDVDGAVASLPDEQQKAYLDFPFDVLASKWADKPASEGPFKIGYVSLAINNAYGTDALAHLKELTKDYAEKGLTEPELITAINADPATQTPAEQIQGYQQLVDQGADAILVIPLSGDAMADAVTAAGEKGVVTVTVNGYIPSPYAINQMMNPFVQGLLPAAKALEYFKGKANVLYVGGIPGETTEKVTNDGFKAMVANCPDTKIIGEVFGNYSVSGAKSAVLQFLASYPGDIDFVATPGTMGPGIISAFEDSGRTVPLVTATGAQAGELAYWDENIDTYTNFGTGGNSTQTSDISLQIALRTLLGQGPIANVISVTPTLITNDNLSDFLVPGADLNSGAQGAGDPEALLAPEDLNGYFTNGELLD